MRDTITIRLPKELRDELRAVSKAERKPVNDLVREALRRYLAVIQFHRLRGKIVPYARAKGLVTDEDVFRAFS
jgi:Arc/MetJ-type ribon-helix-helix transcriptional regulator